MSEFIEAVVTLLPPEAGGRRGVIAPRDGTYRPFARVRDTSIRIRVRFLEGPPTITPGETARVVLEIENPRDDEVVSVGDELELIELEEASIGMATITRVWRRIAAAS